MDGTSHGFSKRTAWDLRPSEFSAAVAAASAAARADGHNLLDLTVSNPTICGFDYGTEATFAPLTSYESQETALIYDPDPRGMRSARKAVARYYEDHGAFVDEESIILTTSTSEAYSWLFRLLCDPGDEALVAQPSYPLFDFLATLDDVVLKPYPLFYDYGWWIDFAELERAITPRTRAILVVHPNNPTGHWTHQSERERLESLCVRHGLALIVDEVFLDYPITLPANEPVAKSFATGPHPALTFVLSGLSKIAALPQMKVAWLAAFGPEYDAAEALARLEVIADTFLSLNATAQLALPSWLANRGQIQSEIRPRVKTNLDILHLNDLEVLRVQAGWSAIIRLRGSKEIAEASAAEALLHRASTIVHPGAFYGLTDRRIVVVSLITPSMTFSIAAGRMKDFEQGVNLMGYPQA